MHRLVIASTTLLTLVGAVVIGGYLLFFTASADRAARAAPRDTAIYVTVFLQPSTGQALHLQQVLGTVPGFADAANLEQKLHELAQRLLGDEGIDYEANVRPWLGNQLSIAVRFDANSLAPDHSLVIIGCKDATAARAALARIMADDASEPRRSDYHGSQLVEADGFAYAVLEDLVIVGHGVDDVRASLDAEMGRASSLAGSGDFQAAMRRLPADHLGAAYVNLDELGIGALDGGYAGAGLALVVQQNAIRLSGAAPFDADAASETAREQFALSTEPSSLADWLPADAEAEIVVFGVRQSLLMLEAGVAAAPELQAAEDAVNQLRALAALGLGINLDDDVLPLFDREMAIGARGLGSARPSGWLLLRPSDADGAAAALDRLRDGLEAHGAVIDTSTSEEGTVTSVDVPDVGGLSYAVRDGVVIVAATIDEVVEVLDARTSGRTLAASDGYRRAWAAAGARAGNEIYLDIGAMADLVADAAALPGDGRDILHAIGALAITAPAHDNATEFHLVLTTR